MTNMDEHYRCKKHTSQMVNASVVMKYATYSISGRDDAVVISVIMYRVSGRDDAVVISVIMCHVSRGMLQS